MPAFVRLKDTDTGTADDSSAALKREEGVRPSKRRVWESRFGELLMSRSLLNERDLLVATERAQRENMALVDTVAALGLVSEEESYVTLAAATGMMPADLSGLTPSPLALRLVSERVARRHMVLPLKEDNRALTYAISEPFNEDAERDVSVASGRRAIGVLAPRSLILNALDVAFPRLADIDLLLDRVRSESPIEMMDCGDALATPDSPITDLCNHIIARAVEASASDVHIESSNAGVMVRYRLCGILETMFTLPPEAAMAVRDRYKVMARADISIRNRPQDGSFRLRIGGHPIDVRLSTLPTINGEKLVMRVIDSQVTPHDLESLGYDANSLDDLKRALSRPDGLVLVTGPTGSGKTTVLYSALSYLRNGHTHIVSLEDPVERPIEGIDQIQVNGRGGNTFAAVLRSVMRQDPHIIMIGEVRDQEVAQMVGQAAYTGHLVLGTLHTADAASAITRLLNLGLEPFRIAEGLTAIVAQRLVRRLCPDCHRRHNDVEAARLGRQHGIPAVPKHAGPGCDTCRHTGYTDRVPVAEVLLPDDRVRAAIGRGTTAAEIRLAMHAAGCHSMRERALALVAQGVTTIEEIDRVLSPDAVAAARQGGKRVLITDDDRITRMLVKLLLEREGYEVLEGETGQHAVELARRERPDLLVIDLMMPEMDGYQAIDRIRRDVSLATLPVIVLTSEGGPGIEHRVLELGADDYMIKPFEPAVLLSRVSAMFRRKERAAAA